MHRYQIYQHEVSEPWVLLDAEAKQILAIGTREEVEASRQLREDNAKPIKPPKLVAIPSAEPVMRYPEDRTLTFFALVVGAAAAVVLFLFLGGMK